MRIKSQIKLMKKYLLMKFEQKDWHGVMDAAADLRELEIKKKFSNKKTRRCLT